MCQTHRGVQYVIPLNRTGHICVYLLLISPEYSQSIPRTSLHKKGFSRVPNSHRLIYLVLYPDTFPHPGLEPTTSSATNIFFWIWASMVYFCGIPSTWHPCYQHTKIYIVSMVTFSDKTNIFCVRIKIPHQLELRF